MRPGHHLLVGENEEDAEQQPSATGNVGGAEAAFAGNETPLQQLSPQHVADTADADESAAIPQPSLEEDQLVDIHKPKPVHSWREFLNELGVIFLGVLIALAFESAAEEWRWHSRVDEAREQLRYELGVNFALLDQRIGRAACMSQRLDRLAAVVQTAVATSRVPPLGDIGELRASTWPAGVWGSAVSAQTAAHFPSRELAALARAYGYLGLIREISDRDAAAWESIRTMVGPGRPITPEITEKWIAALVLIRSDDAKFGRYRQALVRLLDHSGLGRDFPEIDPLNPPVFSGNVEAGCPPFGPAPTSYAAAVPAN